MNRHGIRYMFEHRLLPQWFFEDKNFCIEKGNSESGDFPFVCSWTPDEVQHNHGNCSFEDHNDFMRCADIHMEREYGLTRKDDKE